MTTNKKQIDIRLVKAVLGALPILQLFPKEKSPLHLGIIEIDAEETKQGLFADEKRIDQIIRFHNHQLQDQLNYLQRIEHSLPARTREKLKESIARAKASLNIVQTSLQKRKDFIAPSHSYFEEKPSKAEFEKTMLEHKYVVTEKLIPNELFAASFPAILPFENRERHCHILSGTGGGKSEAMKAMVYHDIQHKHGCLVIDPHGSLADNILGLNVPDEDIVYLSAKFAKEGLNFKLNIFDHPTMIHLS